MTTSRPTRPVRRGSTVIVVLWALAIASLVASSVQLFAFRQAALGRESEDRIQARWAARSGLENTISVLALHTEKPIPDDAFALIRDMEFYAHATLHDASYSILHHVDGEDFSGPMDEHSRMNLNGADPQALGLLEDITPDVVSAIEDWRDEDSDPGLLGAEDDWYQAQAVPVQPRNGAFRSIPELEMVAGVWGDFVRGEDWNMNNRLDPNEDDGARSLPEDEPDGILETGWGGKLTVYSLDDGATSSGLPRMHLRRAEAEELAERCLVDEAQARQLIAFGRNGENELVQLISTPLGNIDRNGNVSNTPANDAIAPLDEEQLRLVLAECSMRPTWDRASGKVNLNTAHPELIRDLLEMQGMGENVADELIYMRNSRPEGLTSLVDLYEIPEMTPEQLVRLAGFFTTHSNIYTVTSRGQSLGSGVQVEIIAVVDRSTVPIRILEYREQ